VVRYGRLAVALAAALVTTATALTLLTIATTLLTSAALLAWPLPTGLAILLATRTGWLAAAALVTAAAATLIATTLLILFLVRFVCHCCSPFFRLVIFDAHCLLRSNPTKTPA
jgi:hypothetical protein